MESWPLQTLGQCFGEAGDRMSQFFELAFERTSLSAMDLTRMQSLLVVGDSGIGKSVSIAIAANHYNLNILRASIGDLVIEYPNQLEKGILQLLHRARGTPRSIIVLDNIELMVPKSGLSDTQFRLRLLDELQKPEGDGPIWQIGCCIDPNVLDDDVKNAFDEVVEFQIPTPEERLHILQNLAMHFNICPAVDIASIAAKLHSYKLADVYALLRLADEKRCLMVAETISETDLLSCMNCIDAIGARGDRTAEQPEPVKWSDIGGLEMAKSTLMECTSWMHDNYAAYERLGGSPSKGVLLYGPPGTGKTLLAKAIASECSANFLAISIPELIKGELISQLIMELDNINHGKDRVLVVTATNHPEKIDRAILRPGRLDQHIFVTLPSEEERLEILQVLSRKSNVDRQTDFRKLAVMTKSFTGADMQALLRKAGLCALKRRSESQVQINEEDFLIALSSLRASISEEQQLSYSRFELTI
ncbi:hypothetical protein Unana1_08645 [Umbelopsis nana]